MAMQLEGAKELERALKTLGERTQRKVVRQAVNTSMTPCLKAARAHAPEESGLLKESLDKKVKTYPQQMVVVGLIGPDTATQGDYKGEKRWPAKYAHLVEDGHIAANGQHIPGQPFMRPAFDETQGQMIDTMKSKLASGIEREAAKLE